MFVNIYSFNIRAKFLTKCHKLSCHSNDSGLLSLARWRIRDFNNVMWFYTESLNVLKSEWAAMIVTNYTFNISLRYVVIELQL